MIIVVRGEVAQKQAVNPKLAALRQRCLDLEKGPARKELVSKLTDLIGDLIAANTETLPRYQREGLAIFLGRAEIRLRECEELED